MDMLVAHLRRAEPDIVRAWGAALARLPGAPFGGSGGAGELKTAYGAFLDILERGDVLSAEAHADRLANLPGIRGAAVPDTIRGYYALFEVLRPHLDQALGAEAGREVMAAAAERLRGAVSQSCSKLSAACIRAAQERYEKWDKLAFRGIRAPVALLVSEMGVLAAGGSQDLPPVLKGVLREALGQGRRLLDLLEGLFTMHRLGEGLVTLRRDAVDLAAVAGLAVEAPAAQLRATARQFGLTASPGSLGVMGDAPLLGRAISLLVDRAGETTPEGKGVTVRLESDAGEVLVQVADEGPGDVPAGDLETVEYAFARLVAERHGGRFTVSRKPGRGTTAEMRIPMAGKGAAVVPAPAEPIEAAPGIRIIRAIAPGILDDTKDRIQ